MIAGFEQPRTTHLRERPRVHAVWQDRIRIRGDRGRARLTRQPFRIVETASWEQNDAYAELLAVNPLGQIPTLVLDDGTALSESAAILIHLGTVHDDSTLLPRDLSARAQAVRGLVYIAANCYAAISIIDYPERWCAEADDDEAVKERIRAGTRARLHRHWEMFADVFALALPWRQRLERARSSRRRRQQMVGGSPAPGGSPTGFHETLQRIESVPDVAPIFARHWPPR